MKKWLLLLVFISIHFVAFSIIQVDLIIMNAKIYTIDSNFSIANVMIVDDGEIKAIGGDTLLQDYFSENTMDIKGQFVYPGFIDAHCHFVGQALDAYKLKLFGVTSFDEVIQKLVDFAKQNNRLWIEGTGWDQNDWPNKQFPNKDTLDALFPDTPIFLLRVDGHAALVNSKALEMATITSQTSIEGGEIELQHGEPTGILIDNAIHLVKEKIPELNRQDAVKFIISAQQKYLEFGLTGVVEPGITSSMLDYMMSVYSKGKLSLQYSFFMNADDKNLQHPVLKKGLKNNAMHMAGYKVYADGALGSRGAFLLQDYSDRDHHHGGLLLSEDSLLHIAKAVANTNLQLSVHAIGDAANQKVLANLFKGFKQR
ncbi:MAG: amidohydrolase family protein [Bacteroidetes bacterium]|nr:amidohydrolase family protein [Bacteroidota bacterium]